MARLIDVPVADLDDAASDAEARVVVAPRLPRRRDLHEIRQCRRHEVLERLTPTIRTRHLPLPSTQMREQMPHRHVSAHDGVAHAEVRDVRPHRRVEIHLALFDQPHHRRRRERLRDRRDREDGVRGHRNRILNVRDAEPVDGRRAAVDDTECDAWDAELFHLRFGERDERVEARVGAGLRAEVAVDRADAQNDRDGETR